MGVYIPIYPPSLRPWCMQLNLTGENNITCNNNYNDIAFFLILSDNTPVNIYPCSGEKTENLRLWSMQSGFHLLSHLWSLLIAQPFQEWLWQLFCQPALSGALPCPASVSVASDRSWNHIQCFIQTISIGGNEDCWGGCRMWAKNRDRRPTMEVGIMGRGSN